MTTSHISDLGRLARRQWPWLLLGVLALVLLIVLGLVLGADAFGSVAEWAAALGTIAAFGATVALLRQDVEARRRDVAERERRQASLVSCWLGEPDRFGVPTEVFVQNASDEPIYHVYVMGYGDLPEWDVVGPRQQVHGPWRPDLEKMSTRSRRPRLSFADAAGLRWQRDEDGILRRPPADLLAW
jgi:hypothetical protein